MPSPIRRIAPQLLTEPTMYGSAGEPQLSGVGSGWTPPGMPMAQRSGGLSLPLMALMAGGMAMSGDAQGPSEPERAVWKKPERSVDVYDETVMPDELKFGRAFAKARSRGLEEFSWRGKRYNTKLKNATATVLNESGYS